MFTADWQHAWDGSLPLMGIDNPTIAGQPGGMNLSLPLMGIDNGVVHGGVPRHRLLITPHGDR